ncbi:MAG: hypothetical protein PWP51_978 [Clostridiales bacterium]|jgi:hypothetical protein|nr:hypothetical protein [Clostridiales bacterium]MDN5298425.1 hypothetical protein [Clostridiales bacterium]
MRVQNSGGLALLVLLLIGAIFGSIIGAALGGILPILAYGKTIGVDPFVVDLSILQMTFGLKLSLNLSGIIGLFLAFIIYRKL